MASAVTFLQLNDGNKMPIMAMGTSEKRQGTPGDIGQAVKDALDIGYRHFDCAFNYRNEDEIGVVFQEAIQNGQVKRKDLFITTKLPSHYNDPKYVREAVDISKDRLKVDYIDLYLIHSPMSIKREQAGPNAEHYFQQPEDPETFFNNVDHADVWKEMEKLVDTGLVKSIGLSNFNQKQIQHILDHCRIKPANLQVECHAYFPQNKLVNFCKQNGIVMTAYAPIGSPGYTGQGQASYPVLLDELLLETISDKYQKTPAQVLLRWLMQRDIGVLPKSIHKDRLKQNFDAFNFELSSEDILKINGLGAKNIRMFRHLSRKDSPHYPFREEDE